MEIINIEKWDRASHFKAFRQFTKQRFSLTTKLNVSELLKSEDNFFNRFLFELMHACNEIEEFKLRIKGDDVVKFEKLDVNINLLAKNNCFESHRIAYTKSFPDFDKILNEKKSNIPDKGILKIDKEQDMGMVVTSYIPWAHFTSVEEPNFGKDESIVKIVYGKYETSGDNCFLPISISAHHALVDGYHIGLFLEKLQQRLRV